MGAAKEKAAREKEAREKAAKEKAARKKAAREKAVREKAAREKAAREEVAAEQGGKLAAKMCQQNASSGELTSSLPSIENHYEIDRDSSIEAVRQALQQVGCNVEQVAHLLNQLNIFEQSTDVQLYCISKAAAETRAASKDDATTQVTFIQELQHQIQQIISTDQEERQQPIQEKATSNCSTSSSNLLKEKFDHFFEWVVSIDLGRHLSDDAQESQKMHFTSDSKVLSMCENDDNVKKINEEKKERKTRKLGFGILLISIISCLIFYYNSDESGRISIQKICTGIAIPCISWSCADQLRKVFFSCLQGKKRSQEKNTQNCVIDGENNKPKSLLLQIVGWYSENAPKCWYTQFSGWLFFLFAWFVVAILLTYVETTYFSCLKSTNN